MKTQTRKRYTLLASVLLVVGGFVLSFFLWLKHEQRQYAMNRELIESLHHGDLKRAIDLVEVGADPNTPVKPLPAPSWRYFLNQILHRSTASPKMGLGGTSPTAFMVVCGDDIYTIGRRMGTAIPEECLHDPTLTRLAKVMLSHGANVNIRGGMLDGTALTYASGHIHWMHDIMILLLEHGADIDQQDADGFTPLYHAVIADDLEGVKLLLKYHANPALNDKSGLTPYAFAVKRGCKPELIRLLKAAGATE